MTHGLETLLVVVLCLIAVMWLVIIVAVGLVVWRLRKAIVTISLALGGLKELTSQMKELSRKIGQFETRRRERTKDAKGG